MEMSILSKFHKEVTMCRIPQKTITGDLDGVDLKELRQRFEAAIGNSLECDPLEFGNWLQVPVGDAGCDMRAKALSVLLKRHDVTTFPNEVSSTLLSPMGEPERKWESVDKLLTKGTVCILKARADQIGGEKSRFTAKFHAMMFLAADPGICLIGFDPDVTATEDSRKLWKTLIEKHETTDSEVLKLDKKKLKNIQTTMLLGEGATGVGPLIRAYYPDRKKRLKKIDIYDTK